MNNTINQTNKFWYENPYLLIEYNDIWPNDDQTLPEKINSITRFVLITGLILSLYNQNHKILYTSIALAIIIAFFMKYIFLKLEKNKLKHILNYDNYPKNSNKYLNNLNQKCRESTINNPFSNPMPGDKNTTLEACSYDNNKDLVNHNFDYGLYKSYWDIYNKNNSQRQYYSIPSTTIPNDQTAYANWLYGRDTNCKINPSICTGFDNGGS